ncbi:response regulator [Dyadobacter sandarakinus]|uniref:Response regulator n=1 Tax=Dyadobacter sandarakinus TaxID=2747268 RepID=A0ABX7I347_9BACT|nr:response regulator [Dyadobacter sandarakinus]QRR00300.1 response regulator [Dyadobacter sandarakinus]
MHKYNLAIVENDEDERMFMRQAFEQSGLFNIVGEFNAGDTLLEWLVNAPRQQPDVILSDLNMPGKNGYDILMTVKGDPGLARIPVFVTSTSNLATFREKCLHLGATDYLVKPELFIDYEVYASDLYQRLNTLPQ